MYGRMYKMVMKADTIENAVSDAFSEVDMIADEMGEWRDSLEERLSHTSKFEMVQEAADTLDQHRDAPDVDPLFAGMKVDYGIGVPKPKKYVASRMSRLGNAVQALNACVETLNDFADTDEEGRSEADQDKARELADELQQHIDELEGVEFPGMYG